MCGGYHEYNMLSNHHNTAAMFSIFLLCSICGCLKTVLADNATELDLYQNYRCQPGYKLMLRPDPNCNQSSCLMIPICYNPCDTVRCPGNKVCVLETRRPGNVPVAVCKDLCSGVNCTTNQSCVVEDIINCKKGLCKRAVCRDPCEINDCAYGHGCYVEPDGKGGAEAVCRHPCALIHCAPGTFCYTEFVLCIKAPCNPIPVCKNPCADVKCGPRERCVLEQAFCINPPCGPIGVCKSY